MRLYIVANITRPKVEAFLNARLAWIGQHAQIVGINRHRAVEAGPILADAILVLGGDGTLLAAARGLRGQAIPLMGVNFGRLGFLANFTPEEFDRDFQLLLARKLPIMPRQTLQVTVDSEHNPQRRLASIALNDAVITAGPPYHMIELALTFQGNHGHAGEVRCAGDGIIVSTPSGSTAYNLSAGGPIVTLGVDAMAITPICPHSLAFRPVVVPINSIITITPLRANAGTTLFFDGQDSTPLGVGDKVTITRAGHDVLLFENPHSNPWQALAQKLHWAAGPSYNLAGE